MISEEEAILFLKTYLKIEPADVESMTKLELLNKIVLQYQHTFPFQSIGLLSIPPSKRHKPTIDEIKEAILSKRGGLCYILNVFLGFLLTALGFEANFGMASVSSPDNHIIVLVSNVVTHSDLFIVEVGCGYPTFQAISLDFEEESPMYSDSFCEYKFIRNNGRIWRMHKKGDTRPIGPNVPATDFIDGCRRFYDFSLETHPLEYYDQCMAEVYSNPDRSPFHKSLRYICFQNQRAFAFKDMTVLEENIETDNLVGKDCESVEDLKQHLIQNLSQFSEECINMAVENWIQINKK